jgi:tetratricopeptide (TPR) repeat protein
MTRSPKRKRKTGRRRVGQVFSLLLLLVLVRHPAPAIAHDKSQPQATAAAKEEAKALSQQASVDYKVGRFDVALVEYTHAYERFNAPGLLFNIGQCHKNLKHFERADFFFKLYLTELPEARNREAVEALIKEVEADRQAADLQAREEQRLAAQRAHDKAMAQAELARLRTTSLAGQPAGVVAQPYLPAKPPLYKNPWFWTGLAGGAVVIGVVTTLAIALSHPASKPTAGTTLGDINFH